MRHTRAHILYPNENNTHPSSTSRERKEERVYFSKDFSFEDCFQSNISKDRGFFYQRPSCPKELRCVTLNDQPVKTINVNVYMNNYAFNLAHSDETAIFYPGLSNLRSIMRCKRRDILDCFGRSFNVWSIPRFSLLEIENRECMNYKKKKKREKQWPRDSAELHDEKLFT